MSSLFNSENWLLEMNSWTLRWQSSRYVITTVLPLSAFNTIALLDDIFLLILLRVCCSMLECFVL